MEMELLRHPCLEEKYWDLVEHFKKMPIIVSLLSFEPIINRENALPPITN